MVKHGKFEVPREERPGKVTESRHLLLLSILRFCYFQGEAAFVVCAHLGVQLDQALLDLAAEGRSLGLRLGRELFVEDRLEDHHV